MNAEAKLDEEVRQKLQGMVQGDLHVTIAHAEGAVFVSISRPGGCKRIRKAACAFLAKRYPDRKVFLLESPRLWEWCEKTWKREAHSRQFVRNSIKATPARLSLT